MISSTSNFVTAPVHLVKGAVVSCSSGFSTSSEWFRSVKRKYDEYQEKKFFLPGKEYDAVARVQIENEIMALRDLFASQQQAINALGAELEDERMPLPQLQVRPCQ
ncbi:hypothetical protein MLD38_033143 [Melastoma candidum]|uniref:Uncharacterized protein n=1 Tax=Melastoma candidum TaxID=119954 RepID=A0ACB9M5L9_9MYRT|nr:hypothetical protein MLD38_033143 [Melastoma candidum]